MLNTPTPGADLDAKASRVLRPRFEESLQDMPVRSFMDASRYWLATGPYTHNTVPGTTTTREIDHGGQQQCDAHTHTRART